MPLWLDLLTISSDVIKFMDTKTAYLPMRNVHKVDMHNGTSNQENSYRGCLKFYLTISFMVKATVCTFSDCSLIVDKENSQFSVLDKVA